MKNVLIVLALAFSISSAFSQTVIEATTGAALSPFATATRVIESGSVTSLAPFGSTISTVQARGVAGKEQLKDELVALNDDMVQGNVKTIDEVRQPALKELFNEISSDEKQMESINSVINSGSRLHKIATVVFISLLAE
jgi:hypothetical protein